MGDALTPEERRRSSTSRFRHWKEHSPVPEGLPGADAEARRAAPTDAKLVLDSVMDSAKTDPDLGTYWAPEDRAWLWYNDTIETHAFALRTLIELAPARRAAAWPRPVAVPEQEAQPVEVDARDRRGPLLARLVPREGGRARRPRGRRRSTVGGQTTTFVFEPDRYTGKSNQVVVPGEKLDPKRDSASWSRRSGQGLAFASATWHFSTEQLPEEERGDFFSVSRKYFQRETDRRRVRAEAARRGRRARGRRRARGAALAAREARRRVRAPARPARRRASSRRTSLSRWKWDLGHRLVRGDARLRLELLLRAAAGRRVHVQVPRPREHGGHVPRRPGDGAVDVRAGVQRLLGGRER